MDKRIESLLAARDSATLEPRRKRIEAQLARLGYTDPAERKAARAEKPVQKERAVKPNKETREG